MRILFSGFEPFGGDKINSSWECVSSLPQQIGSAQIEKALLPVDFIKSFSALHKSVEQTNPDLILLTGQAGKREKITLEKLAINYAREALGISPPKQNGFLIAEEGSAAIFSSCPVEKLLESLVSQKLPVALSLSAGSFVCNALYYQALNKLKTPCLFIHLPYLPEQGLENNAPSLSKESMVDCLIQTALFFTNEAFTAV